jgi:hypothetical protein
MVTPEALRTASDGVQPSPTSEFSQFVPGVAEPMPTEGYRRNQEGRGTPAFSILSVSAAMY